MNSLHRLAISVAAILLALLMAGCFEVKTETQVNRDGTLVRRQIITGDSGEVSSTGFPTIVDSTWTFTVTRPKRGDLERVATKLFRDADELTAACAAGPDTSMHMRAMLDRRFLWFFTELTYTETYLNTNPFTSIPLSDYVSQAAIDQFRRHLDRKEKFTSKGDSLAMVDAGSRFDEWETHNIFESCYAEFLTGVSRLNDPRWTPALLEAHKSEAFREGEGYWKRKYATVDTIEYIFQAVLKSSRVHDAIVANAEGFAAFEAKLSYLRDEIGHPYSTSIIMPGIIIETNAPTIEGNRASWKDVSSLTYVGDLTIWVKSRVLNWWAVVGAGVLVLATVVLFISAIIRKRQPGG